MGAKFGLTLREEHRLRVFENRVLRRVFGPKREEDGSWRKLHNDEIHSLYSSTIIVRVIKSRRMRWAGHVARMGKGRGIYGILVGRPEGMRPPGRPRCRWEDNIKMDLREKGIDGANWTRLAQDRVQLRPYVNTVMNFSSFIYSFDFTVYRIFWFRRIRALFSGKLLTSCICLSSRSH
jgi:hypothetical protein